jgi:hypothetical protein
MVRPRLFYSNGTGTTVMATGGAIVEHRAGGTLDGQVAPDGMPFTESLETARGDLGLVARWLTASSRLISVRGSYGRQSQDRVFGTVRERGARSTGFGEVSLQGTRATHRVVGGLRHDGYAAQDFPVFDYSFDVPAAFAQDEFALGAVRLSLSGRVDAHDEYGVLASPRASLLWRHTPVWTLRLSAGGGAFAPTPFVEDTDETGLSRLAPLAGLDAERAWGASVDVTRKAGGFELTGTLFASDVRNPVQLVDGEEAVRARQRRRSYSDGALKYRAIPFRTLLAIATRSCGREAEVETEAVEKCYGRLGTTRRSTS